MKKSACIEMMFTEVPFEERFFLAKEAGFHYIEFWSWKDKDIAKIKSLCEKYDLKIASFSGDQDFSMVHQEENEAYIDFVVESIKIAIFLDCKYLVLHSNALGEGGMVVNAFHEINPNEKFANMIHSKYIKILYDVYHMQVNEGNIIDSITRYIKSIGYIHVADVPGRNEPGTGEINYKNVMERLRQLDYDGIVGFELFPSRTSMKVAGELLAL
ncbi:MAG: Hydroxypyruvate isomerase [Firmicutes bacterium]|nr:Hydroxypyruvate isomerase [Bacillota bacterium]